MTISTVTKSSWHTTLDYITGRKRAEQGLGFLTTAGDRLNGATTLTDAVQGAIDIAVPFLADWIAVDLALVDTNPKPASYVASSQGASANPSLYYELSANLNKYARPGGRLLVLSAAKATDCTQRFSDISGEISRQATNADIASAAVIPMIANGYQPGLLTALRVSQRRDPEFGEAALLLLGDLAKRLAATTQIFITRQAEPGI